MGPEHVVLRTETFALLRAPNDAAPAITRHLANQDVAFWFAALEEDGLTLLVPEGVVAELGDLLDGAHFEEHAYRVITFTPTLAWDVVGFLSAVTRVIAQARIPLGAISAFHRDHVFIRADLAERALTTLKDALSSGSIP